MTDVPNTSPTISASKQPHRLRRWPLGLALVFVVAAAVGIPYIDARWPYRYRNVEPLLETVFASKIKIDKYHRTYFPRPGFVATGLTLRRNSATDLPPVGSVHDLVVQGSWLDLLLLRKRVALVDVIGLHVVIPAVGSRANHEDFPPGSSAISKPSPRAIPLAPASRHAASPGRNLRALAPFATLPRPILFS